MATMTRTPKQRSKNSLASKHAEPVFPHFRVAVGGTKLELIVTVPFPTTPERIDAVIREAVMEVRKELYKDVNHDLDT